jgi:hypothetical protein
MAVLAQSGGFAIAAEAPSAGGQGFWRRGQPSKNESQAVVAHRVHNSVLV